MVSERHRGTGPTCRIRARGASAFALPASLALALAAPAADWAFEAVPAAGDAAAKERVQATSSMRIDGRPLPIGYRPILRSGEQGFGILQNRDGEPLKDALGRPRISQNPDFSSLLALHGRLFMLTQFETTPGAIYLSTLSQDPDDGALRALSTRPLDLSAVGGGWLHCAGSVTPWNSHLGSEEYEPDARRFDPASGTLPGTIHWGPMASYVGGDPRRLDPYAYGWPLELEVLNAAGSTRITKHYAMGRLSLELARVLPDQRTVYLSDDGTNGGLFLFVADRPGDLSAGRLYAGRWEQAPEGIGGDLSWVDLGHANSSRIRRYLDEGVRFNELFAAANPEQGRCPEGFDSINTGHHAPYQECLRLRPGMALAASRLETRRFAALRGATTEWRKLEGIAFDPLGPRLYLAASAVNRGMEDRRSNGLPNPDYDQGGPNHIRLEYNRCGVVYRLELAGGARDRSGRPIDSPYVAVRIAPELAGRMTRAWDPASPLPAYAPDGPFAANRCDLDAVANPDNLALIPEQRLLIVAEDSGEGHENDALWAYHLEDKTLTRLLSAPLGAELTSTYYYPDIGGYGYLMTVVQHPFAEVPDPPADPEARRARVGYLGPFPAP